MKRTACRRKTPLEKDIQSAICDYLALRKHFFWRQNTAPTVQKSPDGWRFRRMANYTMRGIPDIILIRPDQGYFVGLEVKSEKGSLSPDQLTFARQCKAVGAEYHVVRSLEDVQALAL